ncbi:protein meaA, partial [Streptomyces tendae]
ADRRRDGGRGPPDGCGGQAAQAHGGRVGVPVAHLGDMRRLFQDIPLEQMNTSMTINATAMWLLALYQVVAEEQGADITKLQGTTQNDIVKEYLSRGTHVFPPGPSLRLTTDMIAYTVSHLPKWNPINICSYHLQEAGATPVQEIAYAMSTAIAVLDAVRDSGQVPQERMGDVVGRISFFVNAGVRFVEEMCKMRAFGRIWDRVTRERYGIENPKHRRFRYGVQVNSLGLTEAQPENNVQRIVLEMLAVTLSKDARARAVQLPAWNEALGLPRPWDQQWSLRIQQVLAHESDLLEYEDLFEGSKVVEAKVDELVEAAFEEIGRIQEMGGAMAAVESGYLKSQLVASHAERRARIESGEEKIIGVNAFEGTEPNPLTADLDTAIQTVDPAVEARVIASLQNWRDTRYQPPFNHPRPCKALEKLKEAARGTGNLMEATLECARAGATTGEWAGALREVFGEFRAPTGVSSAPVAVTAEEGSALSDVRRKVELTAKEMGVGKLRFLVGKPGLDGHSNGAEQIAVRARDAGFEVVYQGIRLTPEQIVDAALAEDVHAVGLSILSGSHAQLVPDVLERLRVAGATDIPVIAGGIIPNGDAEELRAAGVAAVFTPKDFDITGIIGRIVDEIRYANKLDPLEVPA